MTNSMIWVDMQIPVYSTLVDTKLIINNKILEWKKKKKRKKKKRL